MSSFEFSFCHFKILEVEVRFKNFSVKSDPLCLQGCNCGCVEAVLLTKVFVVV